MRVQRDIRKSFQHRLVINMNFKELRFENSILALLLSFFLCLNGTASHARPGSFNTNDWQTNGTAEEYFAMFGKFLNEYDLIKMPRDKVIELLGDPNKIVSKQKVPKDCSGCRSIYYIIPKSERNFEFNALRITFLHNEVVAWSIVQDKDESTCQFITSKLNCLC